MRYVTLHERPDLAEAVGRTYGRACPAGERTRSPDWLLTVPLFVMVALEDHEDAVRGCVMVRVFRASSERPAECNPWLVIHAPDHAMAKQLVRRAAEHHSGLGSIPGKPPPPFLGLHGLAREANADLFDEQWWAPVRRTPSGRTVYRLRRKIACR